MASNDGLRPEPQKPVDGQSTEIMSPQSMGDVAKPENPTKPISPVTSSAGPVPDASAEPSRESTTQLHAPNAYADWNALKETPAMTMPQVGQPTTAGGGVSMPDPAESAQQPSAYVPQAAVSQESVPAEPETRKPLIALILAILYLLIALINDGSTSVAFIIAFAVLPVVFCLLAFLDTVKAPKSRKRIITYIAIGVTVVSVVVFGGKMVAYKSHEKAVHAARVAESCQSIEWPDSGLAQKLPAPEVLKGEVYDTSDSVSITLCEATKSMLDKYVEAAKKAGFIVDYYKSSDSYRAEDAEGNEISLWYSEDSEDGNTLSIHISGPQQDEESDSTDSSKKDEQQEKQQDEKDTQGQQSQQNEQSQQQSEQKDSSQVDPNFKATMDSYEKFFDQYVDFMKKYKDSNYSADMLADYTKMMQQYSDTMTKMDSIDQSTLSSADDAYYLEVLGRVTQKLASVQ